MMLASQRAPNSPTPDGVVFKQITQVLGECGLIYRNDREDLKINSRKIIKIVNCFE